MLHFSFTVEEINLVAIYRAETLEKTFARIAAALPDMDEDMRAITEGASRKLAGLTEPDFSVLSFAPAEETDG